MSAPTELLAAAASHTSTGEAVQFWVLGPIAVVGALGMILVQEGRALRRSAWRGTMIILAVFYIAQRARRSWASCRSSSTPARS